MHLGLLLCLLAATGVASASGTLTRHTLQTYLAWLKDQMPEDKRGMPASFRAPFVLEADDPVYGPALDAPTGKFVNYRMLRQRKSPWYNQWVWELNDKARQQKRVDENILDEDEKRDLGFNIGALMRHLQRGRVYNRE